MCEKLFDLKNVNILNYLFFNLESLTNNNL